MRGNLWAKGGSLGGNFLDLSPHIFSPRWTSKKRPSDSSANTPMSHPAWLWISFWQQWVPGPVPERWTGIWPHPCSYHWQTLVSLWKNHVMPVCFFFQVVFHVTSVMWLTSHGISSWRQNKNKWDGGVGIQVALTQVKRRRLDKFLPQFACHKFSHSWHHLIWPETANNDHLLQLIESFTPWSRQRSVAWLFAVINGFKVSWAFDESLSVK